MCELCQPTSKPKVKEVSVNAHLHTPYSFSAFDTLTDSLERAVAENVKVVTPSGTKSAANATSIRSLTSNLSACTKPTRRQGSELTTRTIRDEPTSAGKDLPARLFCLNHTLHNWPVYAPRRTNRSNRCATSSTTC